MSLGFQEDTGGEELPHLPNATAISQNEIQTEATSKSKRKIMKPRSDVWDHFSTIIEEGVRRAKCNYCDKKYCCDTSKNGTSNLKKHLTSCKSHPHTVDTRQSQLSLHPIIEGDGKVFKGELMGMLSNWRFDQECVRSKLAYMLIIDELPFKLVEGEGFAAFVAAAQPRFKIPSRWTVTRDCYQLYLDEKMKLMNYFKKSSQRICITTDTWTSLQKINYMCITAHFIDKYWKLHKKIINFCTIESHRGEELGRQIDGCLRDWGIAKVFSITVDNASSNDTCISYLKARLTSRGCDLAKGKYLHMRCIAHIINLIVVDGLREMNLSIKRVRDAIRFVRQSPARLAKFKDCCEDENIQTKSLLCLDVNTRWNSTYLMLNVAHKFERAFERFEIKDPYFKNELENGVPTFLDWENVRRMIDILANFYELTMRISASLYVTSNEFYHEISTVNCLLKEWVESEKEDVKAMGEKMKAKYDKYWGDPMKINKLIYVAVIVDPRYKLEFIEYALREAHGEEKGRVISLSISQTLEELFQVYKLMYQPQFPSTQEKNQPSSQFSQPEPSRKKSRFLLGDKFKKYKLESGEVENRCDLDLYLKESVLVVDEDDFDILKWWKLSQSRFPILSELARDVLAMPISTVASESAFSTGGRVLDEFRSSLTPKIVEALICTQDWLRSKKRPKTIEEDIENLQKLEEALTNVDISEKNENTTES